MQLLDESTDLGGQRCIVTEHNGEELYWNIVSLPKPKEMRLVVGQLNGFLATMSASRQSLIWDKYKEIHQLLCEVADNIRLNKLLKDKVAELYEMLPYEEAVQYTNMKSDVKLPHDLKDEYSHDAPKGALTYLRPEYTKLVALTLLLRAMFPIWGEYMSRVKDVVGSDFKEFDAATLINKSNLINTPAYSRLEEYINAYVNSSGDLPLSPILGGLGSSQSADWLLRMTLIRRLCVVELKTRSDDGDGTNIVSNIWNYIKNKLETVDKTFAGVIRDKVPESGGGTEEDNTSQMELYKIKEPVAEATIVSFSIYASHPVRMAKAIDPTIDGHLVKECHRQLLARGNFSPTQAQLTVMQYCISLVMPARSGPYMDYEAVVSALSVTQALCWHWGLYDIAILATAVPNNHHGKVLVGVNRTKLTKDQLEALVNLYPHYQVTKGKRDSRPPIHSTSANARAEIIKHNLTHNVAIKAIERLSDMFGSCSWNIKAPEALLALSSMQKGDDGWLIPMTIRNQLADLIFSINELKALTTKAETA